MAHITSSSPIPEIKLITASIYTNYTTHVIDDKGIEPIDAYVTPPKANKLILGFRRVE